MSNPFPGVATDVSSEKENKDKTRSWVGAITELSLNAMLCIPKQPVD